LGKSPSNKKRRRRGGEIVFEGFCKSGKEKRRKLQLEKGTLNHKHRPFSSGEGRVQKGGEGIKNSPSLGKKCYRKVKKIRKVHVWSLTDDRGGGGGGLRALEKSWGKKKIIREKCRLHQRSRRRIPAKGSLTLRPNVLERGLKELVKKVLVGKKQKVERGKQSKR